MGKHIKPEPDLNISEIIGDVEHDPNCIHSHLTDEEAELYARPTNRLNLLQELGGNLDSAIEADLWVQGLETMDERGMAFSCLSLAHDVMEAQVIYGWLEMQPSDDSRRRAMHAYHLTRDTDEAQLLMDWIEA